MTHIASALKPELPDPGAVAEHIKDWAATKPRFARFLNAKMPVVKALTAWAMELLRENQFPLAITVLRSALTLAPGDSVLWANYGYALHQSDSAEAAAQCLEHAVTLSRHQPLTWLVLGLARKKQGDLAAAETAWRVALEQKPDWSMAWQLMGALKEQLKDYAAACDCLITSIKVGESTAAVHANLGRLQYQLGRITDSAEAYGKAAELEPANALFRQMARKAGFQGALIQGESVDEAIAQYRNSLTPEESCSDKELMALLHSAFSMLSGFGHLEAATRVGRKQIELSPENPSLNYLLSAVAQDQTLDRSPPEYVVEHFDAFAEGFEAQLVGVLGYDLPGKICAAVGELTPAGHQHDTLDGGCGTGLCGALLRPLSRTLTGVDLSSKMLEQAARKAIYDTLVREDLTAFLLRSPRQFDLIVAADLMIYFGNLTSLFAAAATALRPAGLFALSTESWSGEGYRLFPSGRFAHGPQYVRLTAERDFEEVYHAETTIRLEATGRVPGNIFIFRRRV